MLTNAEVINAKPQQKMYRLYDERGLYLEVTPNGSRYWRLKYMFNGKDKRMALGVYPEVSLAEAREKRDAARKLVSAGTDPAFAKKENKRQQTLRSVHTFESVHEHLRRKYETAHKKADPPKS